MKRLQKITTVLLGAALAGCGSSPTLEDDLFPDTGRRAPDDDGDVLHGPYATGSRFRVAVAGLDSDECGDVRFESGDESVLGVAPDSEDPCRAIVTANAPGESTLRVVADGDELRSRTIEVATPTRATIHPRGWVRAGLAGAEESWDVAKVLYGGTGTFTVRWWDDAGRELAAHEVLVPTAPEELYLGAALGRPQNVDALQVTPRAVGAYTAEVGTAGARLASITIEVVEEDTLASLVLVPGEIAGEDERSVLVATTRDETGGAVFGAEPIWSVDGQPVRDDDGAVLPGDLFVYEPGGTEHAIDATLPGGPHASQDLAFEGEPSVESSNGCQAIPGLPSSTGAAALVLAALVASRIRRRPRGV